MLKVFLVEDEFVVREGIKKNIDWAGNGYDFVGEAGDGELAFPMIQKLKPDIVITDIKMPFMDGLELSKLIRKEFPWMEIVILSGYAEFDYAKEAISLGVAHYLTKPISGDDLLAEINKLSERIEEKKRERELREKYIHDMEENTAEERRKLFQYMVTGSKSVTELLELAGKLELDISALCYNVVLFKIRSTHHADEEYSGSVVAVMDRIKKMIDPARVLMFDRNTEGIALIYKADSMEELDALRIKSVEDMQKIMEEYPSIKFFGGIGQPVNRLGELSLSFEAASHAFAHRYLMEDNAFISQVDIRKKYYSEEEGFNLSNVDPHEVDRKRVVEFLKQGEREEIVYFIEEFFHNMGENVVNSNIFRQYIAMDSYFAVASFVEELGYDRADIEQFDLSSDLQDVDSTVRYLTRIIDKALEMRNSNVKKKYNDVVEKVLEYINEHYGDEDLSLNSLASYVNFSPNHLSMMFSQQTGMSFIKYLTDYRMNKAKELLRCTNKRSVDISLEVGYKDPHYFSYCFKKYQGVTPTQYRNGGSDDGVTSEDNSLVE